MPDPLYLAVADQVTGMLSFLVQAAADVADQTVVLAQAGDGALDSGGLGVAEDLGGNFDPLTGEPVGNGGAVEAGGADAVDGALGAPANPPAAQQPPSFFEALFANPLLLFGGLMLLLYVMVLGPERRKQTEIAKKRAALKKNDRVVTTGGILGTVVSVSPDSEEVTLRVDESTNTRIRILKSAIGSVLEPGKDKDKPEASS